MGWDLMVSSVPKKLLIHEVTYKPLESEEGWQKEYGEEILIKNVRVEPKRIVRKTSEEYVVVGELILFMDKVHTEPFVIPSMRGKMTFNGKDYTVEDVSPYYGFRNEIHHVEVVLK